jgi:hypothetical protein
VKNPFSILGKSMFNSNGDVDVNSTGFKYIISTLSYIRSKIIEQKFFEVDIADYLPVDVGEAAFSDEIVQNTEFYTGGSFFEGDVDQGGSRISQVDATMVANKMPVRNWRKKVNWTLFEIQQAAVASRWDPVEAKMRSLKKNWDLGIQELAFLGRPGDTVMTGLLNNAVVTINTTRITKKISAMAASDFSTFIAGILGDYYANSNSTTLPDTFVMPTADYLGLGVLVPGTVGTYPVSMKQYLENMFKSMTNNDKFKILPVAYATAANSRSDFTKDRYVLYRRDPETLSLSIPVDYTMAEPRTVDSMDWLQLAYGQYSGVLVNRPREVLYYALTT